MIVISLIMWWEFITFSCIFRNGNWCCSWEVIKYFWARLQLVLYHEHLWGIRFNIFAVYLISWYRIKWACHLHHCRNSQKDLWLFFDEVISIRPLPPSTKCWRRSRVEESEEIESSSFERKTPRLTLASAHQIDKRRRTMTHGRQRESRMTLGKGGIDLGLQRGNY